MTVARAPFRYVREADRLPDGDAPVDLGPLDPAPILGTWRNTNERTWGITRAELVERDGQVWIHVWAAGSPGDAVHDWGEAPVQRIFTDGPLSNRVCGYTATFDHGHARTHIQANQNHGLTVIAAFTTFVDGSGRLDYFSREFYHRR